MPVLPVPKRAFAFRYIESLGPKNHGCPADKPFEHFRLPDGKNRLSQAVRMSNFRGLGLEYIHYSENN